MDKTTIIAIFALPNMRAIAALLRARDVNSTGVDDEAADAMDYAIGRLERYLLNPRVSEPPQPPKG